MKTFTNSFEDSGKAITDTVTGTISWYSFSSDAHIIAEDPSRYRIATEEEEQALLRSGKLFVKP